MFLCFGTFANILKKCAIPKLSNRVLVSTLVGTIDPNNRYGDKNNDTAVSRLMNCDRNFPTVEVEATNGPVRTVDGSQTNIIALARSKRPIDVEQAFDPVIALLDEDKKITAVGALHFLIRNDESLEKTHRSLFVKCMGTTAANVVAEQKIDLRAFLARVFLYTVLLNENTKGKETLKDIRGDGFMDRFTSYAVLFYAMQKAGTQEIEGSVPSGVNLYMAKLKDKYNCLPTILHKEAFTPFRDYYVPNNVEWHEKIPGERFGYRIRSESNVTISKLVSISRFLVLSGTGGLGKSMMMRNLMLSCVDEYETLGLVPLFIPLKDYELSYIKLLDYIYDMVRNLWSDLTVEELIGLLNSGKVLLLFDGLDEIPTSSLAIFTKQLNAFIDRYTTNTYIISSRPYSNFQSFTRFMVLRLQPFTKRQALELVDRFNYRADAPKLQANFRNLLETSLYWTHKGFSDNPLLLSIMLLTFEMDADVPTIKYVFYQEAYTVLSKRHDASKDGYTRSLKTGWTTNEFEKYFCFFCAISYSRGKISFTYNDMDYFFQSMDKKYDLGTATVDDFIYDAINNLCIMYQDGINYEFIHRSFQEYFCAKFFHKQLDEDLKRVIPIFDRNETTKKDDMALSMLYDMKPQAVERYLILPYLQDFIRKCDEGEGLWTFLKTIYPDYEIADGEAITEDEFSEPHSNLYAFILTHYDIPLLTVVPDETDGIECTVTETMVYREDTKEDTWKSDLPFDYDLHYGEPEVTGHIYHFDWDDIQARYRYRELKASLENENSPFQKEYASVRNLLNELTQKTAPTPATEDPFDRMF